MSTDPVCRYFTTYSGIRLPFKLTAELEAEEINNRNTFFRGFYDTTGLLLHFEKVVYGEVELAHRYTYNDEGELVSAEITDGDGEVTVVECR